MVLMLLQGVNQFSKLVIDFFFFLLMYHFATFHVVYKENCKLILGTRQLTKLLKYISINTANTITGKWHSWYFKNRNVHQIKMLSEL